MSADELRERLQIVRRSSRVERLRARAPRYAFLVFVGITSLLGLREIFMPREPATPAAPPLALDRPAESYAVELTRAYLSFDAARPELRERRLEPLLPDELSPDAGFVARSGSRAVVWAEVAESRRDSTGARLIVVAAQTDDDLRPFYLAVRVDRNRRGDLRLVGYPALVGPPSIARAGLPEREEVEDGEVAAVARRVIANYLAGEAANLEADLAPRALISLPSPPLEVRAVEEIAWAEGPGSGSVLVTVTARDQHRATYTLTYGLGIEYRRGRPYVSFIETVPNEPVKEG